MIRHFLGYGIGSRFTNPGAALKSDRFWTAPVLWRCSIDCPMGNGRNTIHLILSRAKAIEDYRSPKRFASPDATSKCPNPRSAGAHAFTLIELMVVLAVIGIMSAMLIPEMKGTYEDAILRATGRKLITVFSLASSRAIAINQLHRVRFDFKKGRYLMERSVREDEGGTGFVPLRDLPGGDGDLDSRVSILIREPNDDPQDAAEMAPPLVSEKDSRKNSDENAISFYPGGTADAREIILRDRDGFRLSLRINPTTARVHILELERQ